MIAACVRVGVLMGVVACASEACGQWTVRDLNPAGEEMQWYESSQLHAMSGGRQGGEVLVLGPAHASLWSGTAGSWVDLHPAGYLASAIYAIDGERQAGVARLSNGLTYAGMWSGTAASWVDLHPAGAQWSAINGAKGGVQVGEVRLSGVTRASLWSGTAGSWVDLHPGGIADHSVATALDGEWQGGWIIVWGVFPRAALWHGSAASMVSLHTDENGISSRVWGMDGGRQVGCLGFPPHAMPRTHAGMWSGTAESWVDLHPIGALESEGLAIHGAYQAGWVSYVMPGGQEVRRASVWRGTADSWEDLSAPLNGAWHWTVATSVWVEGETLYVAGYGRNLDTDLTHGLLWSRPIGEGVCFSRGADFDGDGDFGTDADIEAFFECLAGRCCGACLSRGADFDGDGDVGTDRDIEEFFRVLAGGAC